MAHLMSMQQFIPEMLTPHVAFGFCGQMVQKQSIRRGTFCNCKSPNRCVTSNNVRLPYTLALFREHTLCASRDGQHNPGNGFVEVLGCLKASYYAVSYSRQQFLQADYEKSVRMPRYRDDAIWNLLIQELNRWTRRHYIEILRISNMFCSQCIFMTEAVDHELGGIT